MVGKIRNSNEQDHLIVGVPAIVEPVGAPAETGVIPVGVRHVPVTVLAEQFRY